MFHWNGMAIINLKEPSKKIIFNPWEQVGHWPQKSRQKSRWDSKCTPEIQIIKISNRPGRHNSYYQPLQNQLAYHLPTASSHAKCEDSHFQQKFSMSYVLSSCNTKPPFSPRAAICFSALFMVGFRTEHKTHTQHNVHRPNLSSLLVILRWCHSCLPSSSQLTSHLGNNIIGNKYRDFNTLTGSI